VVKRAVSSEDPASARGSTVRAMVYLALTYDHRIGDRRRCGAVSEHRKEVWRRPLRDGTRL